MDVVGTHSELIAGGLADEVSSSVGEEGGCC